MKDKKHYVIQEFFVTDNQREREENLQKLMGEYIHLIKEGIKKNAI